MFIPAKFPDTSWLRIFHFHRDLRGDENAEVERLMGEFLGGWSSHEQRVEGGFVLHESRFLLVFADEGKVHLSGCSKDQVNRAVTNIGQRLGLETLESPPLVYRRKTGVIEAVSREEFAELAARGEVNAETRVFDETLGQVGDVRRGLFERAAAVAWHSRAFELPSGGVVK